MESRVPVPTDNIYKFYALFGLLLVIFSFGASLYQTRTSNDLLFAAAIELAELRALEEPNAVEKARLKVAERRAEVTISNSKFYFWAIPGVAMIGAAMMFFGFGAWHKKVQPAQDEMTQLQLDRLRYEVARLKLESAESSSQHRNEARATEEGHAPPA